MLTLRHVTLRYVRVENRHKGNLTPTKASKGAVYSVYTAHYGSCDEMLLKGTFHLYLDLYCNKSPDHFAILRPITTNDQSKMDRSRNSQSAVIVGIYGLLVVSEVLWS